MTISEMSNLLFAEGWIQTLAQGAVKTLGISLGAFALGLCIGLLVALIKLRGHAGWSPVPTATPRCTAPCRNCC